jgi:hypothetical protein
MNSRLSDLALHFDDLMRDRLESLFPPQHLKLVCTYRSESLEIRRAPSAGVAVLDTPHDHAVRISRKTLSKIINKQLSKEVLMSSTIEEIGDDVLAHSSVSGVINRKRERVLRDDDDDDDVAQSLGLKINSETNLDIFGMDVNVTNLDDIKRSLGASIDLLARPETDQILLDMSNSDYNFDHDLEDKISLGIDPISHHSKNSNLQTTNENTNMLLDLPALSSFQNNRVKGLGNISILSLKFVVQNLPGYMKCSCHDQKHYPDIHMNMTW